MNKALSACRSCESRHDVSRGTRKTLWTELLPSHAAPMRQRMVKAEESGRIDHRKVERQHENLGTQRPYGPERRQNIKDELRAEDSQVKAGIEQEQVRYQSNQHRERHHEPAHLVR